MKIVVNRCYGGFSLSALAVKRLAEFSGRKCYFFVDERDKKGNLLLCRKLKKVSLTEAEKTFIFYAYDVPEDEYNKVKNSMKPWNDMTDKERVDANKWDDVHSFGMGRDVDRSDLNLIKVVEELGAKANGKHAQLEIVEIPDGVQWQIEEYDGQEWVSEVHRTW
jgi:hypothetical protein